MALAGSAISSAPGRVANAATTRSSLTIDIAHSTLAAESGTDRLSSRRIGTVSTAAATIAATNGAPTENHE